MTIRIFDPELVEALNDKLQEKCSDGSCLTAKNLTLEVGLSEEDVALVSACVKRHLSTTVGVHHGPHGGFRLFSVPLKEQPKAPQAPKELPDGFIDSVKEILEGAKRNGLSNGFIQGKLDERYPNLDATMITQAIRQMGGYESKPGLGWVRQVEETVVNTNTSN